MKNELFDYDVERLVLGCCLVSTDAFTTCQTKLMPADFGIVAHKLIFESIEAVFERTGTTDPVLVFTDLRKRGELNRVGGASEVYELQAAITETESVGFYSDILKDLSTKRRIKSICASVDTTLADESKTATELLSKIASDFESVDTHQNILESITAQELSEMDVGDCKWFVDGLIPDGLTVLAGPAKIGKSFFAWNIAISVATSGVALSNIPIQTPRNVTYLALEDPLPLLRDRLDMIAPDGMPPNLHIISDFQNFKFDNIGLRVLENHIDTTKSEMIVIDTWRHVCPEVSVNGSSYDIDYNAMIPVQKFAHSKNIAVVLVTHTRKATDLDNVFNQIQGSMGVQAGCDTMLMLARSNGSSSLHVTGRRVREMEYALTLDDGLWQMHGDADEYQKTQARSQILDALYDAGEDGMRSREIAELTDKREQAVSNLLRRMLKAGEIHQPESRGAYVHHDFYTNGNGIPL